MELSGKKIAILATNGFEQSELEVPRDELKAVVFKGACKPSVVVFVARLRPLIGPL